MRAIIPLFITAAMVGCSPAPALAKSKNSGRCFGSFEMMKTFLSENHKETLVGVGRTDHKAIGSSLFVSPDNSTYTIVFTSKATGSSCIVAGGVVFSE